MLRKLSAIASIVLLGSALQAQSDEFFGKWEPLLNGKDTTGWRNAKADTDKPCGWVVADGALTNVGGKRIDICTAKEFADYELEIEYKILRGGNSGVYLRGQIEVQILDNFDKEGRPVPEDKLTPGHSGGIYAKGGPLKNPQKMPPEWNKFLIRHIGKVVTVWHNGVLVQDAVYVPSHTPGEMKDDSPTGPIMLQGDHGDVWFRNIRIRELARGDGWKPLWNGKDLSEFNSGDRKVAGLWEVKDGAFTNTKWGGEGHDLWTNGKYGNFLVHYEYRSDPTIEGGNSGFYLRDQWEIQILGDQSTTEPHSDGSLYSKKAPAVKARNKPDEWNVMDVKMDGMKIWVWQNGKLIHDGVELDTRTDNHGWPTRTFSRAPFKLQGDHGKVWFTNLWIKELPDTPDAKLSK